MGARDSAVLHKDGCADLVFALGMGVSGESAGPGDVSMAGGVEGVAGFAKGPLAAGESFAQGGVIRGDVLLAARETFLGGCKLIHQGETEVMFFAGEINFHEAIAEAPRSFPADLFAEAGLVAGGLDRTEVFQEAEQDGLEEVPRWNAHRGVAMDRADALLPRLPVHV